MSSPEPSPEPTILLALLSILGADQKDRGLWGRDWVFTAFGKKLPSVESQAMQWDEILQVIPKCMRTSA